MERRRVGSTKSCLSPVCRRNPLVHKDRLYLLVGRRGEGSFRQGSVKFEEKVDLLLKGASPSPWSIKNARRSGSKEHQAICLKVRASGFRERQRKGSVSRRPRKYYPTFAGSRSGRAARDGSYPWAIPRTRSFTRTGCTFSRTSKTPIVSRSEYKTFSDLDVAEGGYCPVCRVEESRSNSASTGIPYHPPRTSGSSSPALSIEKFL